MHAGFDSSAFLLLTDVWYVKNMFLDALTFTAIDMSTHNLKSRLNVAICFHVGSYLTSTRTYIMYILFPYIFGLFCKILCHFPWIYMQGKYYSKGSSSSCLLAVTYRLRYHRRKEGWNRGDRSTPLSLI